MKAAVYRQSGRLHRYREPIWGSHEREEYERSSHDETGRNVAAFQGADGRCLFLLTMLTAAFTELFVRISGRLNFAADLTAGIVEVSSMCAVTLLF